MYQKKCMRLRLDFYCRALANSFDADMVHCHKNKVTGQNQTKNTHKLNRFEKQNWKIVTPTHMLSSYQN